MEICNSMICRISVCEKYNFEAKIQIQIYRFFFLQMKKQQHVDCIFFSKYKLNLLGYHFFRQIQTQIYLGVPILANVNIYMIIQTDIQK